MKKTFSFLSLNFVIFTLFSSFILESPSISTVKKQNIQNHDKAVTGCDVYSANYSKSTVEVSYYNSPFGNIYASGTLYTDDVNSNSMTYENAYTVDITIDVSAYVQQGSGSMRAIIYEDNVPIDTIYFSSTGTFSKSISTSTIGSIGIVVGL